MPLDQTVLANSESKTFTYDFTITNAMPGAKFVFMLGCVGTTENVGHNVQIDNVLLYRIA